MSYFTVRLLGFEKQSVVQKKKNYYYNTYALAIYSYE